MTPARLFLPALALLAACATPQEACIGNATRELRTLDTLIAETEANLARGYAFETIEVTRPEWVICGYYPAKPKQQPKPRYCFQDVTETSRREVAIDPAAEKRKLAGLVERRRALNGPAASAIAECRARYPQDA
jgi:hypothetical protein